MAKTDLDADEARAEGVFVPPASKEEYLAASEDTRRGFTKTADADDLDVGWTAARGALADPTELPGQVFDPRQLPDPEVARAAGFAPLRVPEHLILEVGELHPQGPEPSEVAVLEHREELRKAYVSISQKAKEAAAEAQDEDAEPQQGTSKQPAGGSPGEATQADEKGAKSGARGSRSSS